MASTKLFLGNAAFVEGNTMTIPTGKILNVVDAPATGTNIANKSYVDAETKKVKDALDLIAGTDTNYDTLAELKTLAETLSGNGATNLSTAISGEKTRAETAEGVLRTDLSAEVIAARAAEGVLRTDLSAEKTRAETAEFKLQTMNVLSSTPVLYVPTVYADSDALPTPLEKCIYDAGTNASIFDGWRMRNTYYLKDGAVKKSKFNFYLPLVSGPKITVVNTSGASITLSTTGLKVRDIKAMYLETCIISAVSRPFITFYTVPKKDGNDESWWYRSRHTFIANSASVANTNYNMVANLKNITNIKSTNFLTQQSLTLDTFSSRRYNNTTDDDDILSIAVSSDSSAAEGNVECIIGKFNIQLDAGIHEFVFSNSHVFADFMKKQQTKLWNALYGTSSTDDPFMSDSFVFPNRTY